MAHEALRKWLSARPEIESIYAAVCYGCTGKLYPKNNQGGIMEYFIAENKLRFAVNKSAAKEKGLSISSKLLMIAKIIE